MNTLLIGYDLNRVGQDYTKLITAIKGAANWWHHLDSTWIVVTGMTASELRDKLTTLLDTNDELLIVDITGKEAAWKGFDAQGSTWLRSIYDKAAQINDLADLELIVTALQDRTAQRRDLVAALILLRERIPRDDCAMLLDIGHCVAHDNRDRGLAHAYIESFMDHFVSVVKAGGNLKVETLFPLRDVVTQLANTLEAVGVTTLNRPSLEASGEHVQSLLMDVLDGVKVSVTNDHVLDCQFTKADTNQGVMLGFSTHFKGLESGYVLKISTNVAIAFPVF